MASMVWLTRCPPILARGTSFRCCSSSLIIASSRLEFASERSGKAG